MDNGSNMIKAFRDWLQEIQNFDEDERKEELLIDPLTGSLKGKRWSTRLHFHYTKDSVVSHIPSNWL